MMWTWRTLSQISDTSCLAGPLTRAAGLLVLLGALAACPKAEPRPAGGTLRALAPTLQIRSYSETQPYTSVTALGGQIYAGTPAGVIRFDQDGKFVRLTKQEGLSGSQVTALSGNSASGLWVATESGISRNHDGVWTNVPLSDPPGAAVTAMVATSWGVWAGGNRGVGRLKDGTWKGFLPGAQVKVMIGDITSSDGVWVGTDGEGIYRFVDGAFVSHNPARGQPLRKVRGLTYSQNGGLIAVGLDQEQDRLVFFDGQHWSSYTLRPACALRWVQQVGDRTLLACGEQILQFRQLPAQNLPRASVKVPEGPVLLEGSRSPQAPAGYPIPIFYTSSTSQWLPPQPTVVLGHGRDALIGTRTTGLVRYDGRRPTWYRTNDLLGQAEKLRVACLPDGVCYMAGAGGRGYRFADNQFDPVALTTDPTATVEAFVNDPGGAVVGIHATGDGKALVVSKLAVGAKPSFGKLSESKITIPGGRVEVRFARYDPSGRLWVGLQYKEDEGDRRPWGVAILGQDGSTLAHRSTLLPTEDRPKGSLALPDDVRDVQFIDGYIWLATGTGACRVRGDQVDLFTENEGLESEIVHRFAKLPGGEILVASHGGVGSFRGKEWRFDFSGPLRSATRALLADGEVLWAGTSRGLVKRVGTADQTFDLKLGLAGDVVYDLLLDPRRRLWVLTDQGLSILTR